MGYKLKLKLGVIDVPEPNGNTTYGVGKILEDKYTLFSSFADMHQQDIANDLSDSVAGAIETYLATGRMPKNPFSAANEQITNRLKKFIYTEELAGKVAGVPTQAALEGVTTRKVGRKKFKRTKTGVRRPSFIDSGVFEASTKVWVE